MQTQQHRVVAGAVETHPNVVVTVVIVVTVVAFVVEPVVGIFS
jgi:hypothetical protein